MDQKLKGLFDRYPKRFLAAVYIVSVLVGLLIHFVMLQLN